MNKVKIQLLGNEDLIPRPEKEGDVGYDLRAAKDAVINSGERALIPCGFKMEIEPGYEAQVRPRSGMALKKGVTVLNTPGTIDPGYRGEVGVILINFGEEVLFVKKGERIAQMIFNKVETPQVEVVQELSNSQRGEGGFGSTGVK